MQNIATLTLIFWNFLNACFTAEEDCYRWVDNEISYTGTKNVTKFGTPCLRWDHPGIDSVYSSGNEHGNYCRSPDSTPFLICFILDKKGVITDEKCDVPECTGSQDIEAITRQQTSIMAHSTKAIDNSIILANQHTASVENGKATKTTEISTLIKAMFSTVTETTVETRVFTTIDISISSKDDSNKATRVEAMSTDNNTNSWEANASTLKRMKTSTEKGTSIKTTKIFNVKTTIDLKENSHMTSTTIANSSKASQNESSSATTTCSCSCNDRKLFWHNFFHGNLTKEERNHILDKESEKIRNDLRLNLTHLSSYIRRKTSAVDTRPSSVAIGTVASVTMAVVFFILVRMDGLNTCSSIRRNK